MRLKIEEPSAPMRQTCRPEYGSEILEPFWDPVRMRSVYTVAGNPCKESKVTIWWRKLKNTGRTSTSTPSSSLFGALNPLEALIRVWWRCRKFLHRLSTLITPLNGTVDEYEYLRALIDTMRVNGNISGDLVAGFQSAACFTIQESGKGVQQWWQESIRINRGLGSGLLRLLNPKSSFFYYRKPSEFWKL